MSYVQILQVDHKNLIRAKGRIVGTAAISRGEKGARELGGRISGCGGNIIKRESPPLPSPPKKGGLI